MNQVRHELKKNVLDSNRLLEQEHAQQSKILNVTSKHNARALSEEELIDYVLMLSLETAKTNHHPKLEELGHNASSSHSRIPGMHTKLSLSEENFPELHSSQSQSISIVKENANRNPMVSVSASSPICSPKSASKSWKMTWNQFATMIYSEEKESSSRSDYNEDIHNVEDTSEKGHTDEEDDFYDDLSVHDLHKLPLYKQSTSNNWNKLNTADRQDIADDDLQYALELSLFEYSIESRQSTR